MNLLLRRLSTCFIYVWFAVEKSHADKIIYRSSCTTNSNRVPDIYKTTTDFIEANGYVAEVHSVTTEDRYILTLHRIPGERLECSGKVVQQQTHRPAVLIQHGIIGSSDNWLLKGINSLPFLLVKNGYDVWLGNTRGSHYSNSHVKLSPRDKEFWDFRRLCMEVYGERRGRLWLCLLPGINKHNHVASASLGVSEPEVQAWVSVNPLQSPKNFHEQGYFDLSAMTDYILNFTRQKKIFFIGHSRGSTMAYVLLSLRPEYNSKFRLMVNYSPVAYVKYARSPIIQFVFQRSSLSEIQGLSRSMRSLSLPAVNSKRALIASQFCRKGSPIQELCLSLIFSFSGRDNNLIISGMLPVIVAHFPDGGSLKEFLHYIQIGKTDKFRQYDYGSHDNLRIYGRHEPPEYNIENITVPTALFAAPNDLIVSREDFQRLSSRLKRVVGRYVVPFSKFNHVDFLWGRNAEKLVYIPTIELMNRFL